MEDIKRYLDYRNPLNVEHFEMLNKFVSSIQKTAYKAQNEGLKGYLLGLASCFKAGDIEALQSKDYLFYTSKMSSVVKNKYNALATAPTTTVPATTAPTITALTITTPTRTYQPVGKAGREIIRLREKFFEEKKAIGQHNSKATLNAYEYSFQSLDRFRPVTSILEYDYQYFIDYFKHNASWSSETKRSRTRDIKAFFNWIIESELLPNFTKNPMKKFKHLLKSIRKEMPQVTREQFQFLVNHTRNNRNLPYLQQIRNLAVLFTLFGTSVRRQELCDLNIADIDFTNRTINIKKGKGNKFRPLILHPLHCEVLQEYLSIRKQMGYSNEALLLHSKLENGTYHRITPSSVRRILETLRLNTGIVCNAHAIRRGSVTELIQNGADPYTIRDILGHSDLRTTDLYINIKAPHMRKVIDTCHPFNDISY